MQFLILIAAVLAALAVLAWAFGWKAIDGFAWRRELRLWSTRLHLSGTVTTLAGYLQWWSMMPVQVQRALPSHLELLTQAIGVTLFICGAIAVKIRQDKLHAGE